MSFLFALVACLPPLPATDEPTDGPVPTGDTAEVIVHPTLPPTPPPTSLVAGPDGGTLVFDGVEVDVPAGALTEDVTIEVSCAPTVPEGFTALSDRCTFQPDGLAFAAPVTLSIPLLAEGSAPRFFWGTDEAWAQLPATYADGLASVEVESLASGFVAENAPIREITDVVSRQADILMVVDNSCSMSEAQDRLGAAFPGFYDHVAGSALDWRIGVTTTDVEDPIEAGKLRRVITGGTGYRWVEDSSTDPATLFDGLVSAGVNGSPTEQGRASAYAVLETNAGLPRNANFQRGVDLHLLFVSDENDQSTSPAVDFRNWFTAVRTAPQLSSISAITGQPGISCTAVYETGAAYNNYANWSGGERYDFCVTDWNGYLRSFAEQVSLPVRTIPVQGVPSEGSLVVQLHDPTDGSTTELVVDDEWTWDPDASVVVLAEVPVAGMQVWVDLLPE